LGRTSLARLTVVVTVLLVIVAAPRAHAAWPAPGDVLVLTTSFDGAKFHGHVFAVDPVTLVKTRVVDFDTFFDPEIYIASSDRHIIPNGIAAAPDGSIWAFYSGGVLLKINADAPHRIYTLGVTQPVSGMAFLPDGRAIVVTNNSTLAGLYRVDPATGEVATFLLNNSPTDPDCNPATSVCLPIHFREGYGVTVDPATGHIYVGDVEGGAKATPTGTVCQELADCGAVYEVVPGAEFLVTDPNSPYFGKKVISGTKTLRADFGDPARGTIGEDAGISIALASDGTILVTDPAFQSAGGKSGALFRVQLNGTHQVVTRFDVLQGQPGGVPNISGPFPVVITGDGTVLIGDCDGDVASLAICAV
jgi:DNA-binding beta-propeller fold protein YncE